MTPQEELEVTLNEMNRLLEDLKGKITQDEDTDTAETTYGEWKPKLDSFKKKRDRVVEALSAAQTGAAEDEARAHLIKPDSDDTSEEKRNKEAQKKELEDSAKSARKQLEKAADEQFKQINKDAQLELGRLKDVLGTT